MTKIGDFDNFKFDKNKLKPISKLGNLRESNRVSFYLRPRSNPFPKEPCGFFEIDNNLPNLDLLNKPGREPGTVVLYDPIQQDNYRRLQPRYEKALSLRPTEVKTENNKIIYQFCSSDSPVGFWRVEVGGGGTFLRFGTPILTIICPKPFQLQDLTTVETDGTAIEWTQLQGRETIISPNSGDGSLNPFVSIIGARDPLDPPILLQAVLEDNTLISDTLVIQTTATDHWDGFSGSEVVSKDSDPCRSVPCQIIPLPRQPNTALCWQSGSIDVTWLLPSCYQDWFIESRVQQNTGGTYQDIAIVPATGTRRFSLTRDEYYRILSIHNVLNAGYSVNQSCRFYYPLGSTHDFVFADDEWDGFSGSEVVQITQYNLGVKTVKPDDDEWDGFSGSEAVQITQYELTGAIIG